MITEVKDLALKYNSLVKGYREHLHQYPELSFQEEKTHDYIVAVLKELGISYRSNVGGGTGIIAELGSGEKTIALRADIDALPIQESGSHSYKSKNQGVRL